MRKIRSRFLFCWQLGSRLEGSRAGAFAAERVRERLVFLVFTKGRCVLVTWKAVCSTRVLDFEIGTSANFVSICVKD